LPVTNLIASSLKHIPSSIEQNPSVYNGNCILARSSEVLYTLHGGFL
jgi:hypothetical protein